jgi:uncharacterized linocin/CFP29 family protein
MDYLNRRMAPFGEDIWKRIDEAAVKAARDVLTGRRFLEVDGPYGVGLTSVEVGHDDYCRQPTPEEAAAVMGRAISLPMLRKELRLSIRRVAAFQDMGQPLNLTPVEDAAEAVARREEEFIYYGQPDFRLQGLLTAEGRAHHDGGDWGNIDQALEDVLAAVNALDARGFRGPYALALSPLAIMASSGATPALTCCRSNTSAASVSAGCTRPPSKEVYWSTRVSAS